MASSRKGGRTRASYPVFIPALCEANAGGLQLLKALVEELQDASEHGGLQVLQVFLLLPPPPFLTLGHLLGTEEEAGRM